MNSAADALLISATANGLDVGGDIDASTAPNLAGQLAARSTGDVLLNMAAVRFIDSSGLRVLVAAHQRLEGNGHRLFIHSPSAIVRRLLNLSGLTDYLHVLGSESDD